LEVKELYLRPGLDYDVEEFPNGVTDIRPLSKLENLRKLVIFGGGIKDIKPLKKLTQLTFLSLRSNPDLTKAQIDELQKALPKCKIYSDPNK